MGKTNRGIDRLFAKKRKQKKDVNYDEQFSRRAFIIGAGQGLFLTLLGGRLAWLQIKDGDKYKTLAESNRINSRMIVPSRGLIVDRYGVPLAVNEQDFQVQIIPAQIDNIKTTIVELKKFITIDERDIQKLLKEYQRGSRYLPQQIRNNLTWDEVAVVELNTPNLPGVFVEAGERRSYPFRESAAHVLGYVGKVSETEMTDDVLLRQPGFAIGKNGLEKGFESDLRGTAGQIQMEVNVHGREVRELGRTPSIAGKRLTLSLDAELQRLVQERLALEKSASAIIMDVKTGAIYALASHPSFDPNQFTQGISTMLWEQLRDDETHPLNNKVISGLYPPGSTFKMMTALAGLEDKKIDENWTINCPGHYDFGNHRFHCWKRGGHGSVNLRKAIAESCDTYFYKMSTLVGIDKIADISRRFGLGSKFDIGLPEEKAGLIPDQKWKRKNRKEAWMQGETIVASIGQGYIQASPLQLVTMTARLVNGGFNVSPWIVGYTGTKITHTSPWQDMRISKDYLALIKDGMDHVLMPSGTAYSQRITEAGMEMGGKTGTSQVRRIRQEDRARGMKQEELPWKFRHHALFVGYAPMVNPRYACAVVVEHGASGSGAAAPIAKDIMLIAQKRDPASKPMEPASI
jgi:penicillin-binding protein 2